MGAHLLAFTRDQEPLGSNGDRGEHCMADNPIEAPEPTFLAEELAYFEENRTRWLKEHAHKYALVRGSRLYGMFDSAQNAYAEGVRLWGNEPMLIKQVEERDPVAEFPALTLGLICAHP
jgi:hypothetical protein